MEPFQQGALDCTCGLYAVINAIRLAVGDNRLASAESCLGLYYSFIQTLEHKQSVVFALQEGLSTQMISALLHTAKVHLRANMGLKLDWQKPFHNRPTQNLGPVLTLISTHRSRGGSVILGTEGKHDHWTVVQKVTSKSLMLADSNNLKSFAVSKICIADKPQNGKLHRICISSIFLLRCDSLNSR